MIRAARAMDAPEIERMIRATHARSKYAGRCDVSAKAVQQLILGLVMGQNQNGPQGSHLSVIERDGKLVGFIAGTLNRIYNIGNKLGASDLFLVNEGNRPADTARLINSYVRWARANPKVLEISLTWTDTVPGAARVGRLYRRAGFTKIGELYELRIDTASGEGAL